MLNDSITLVDSGSFNHAYVLSFRDGYNSIRRHSTEASNLHRKLEVKNTIDLNATDKPNRHLISLSRLVEDAVTGEFKQVTVHCVVTRHKDIPDATVTSLGVELAGLLADETQITKILKGES